MAVNPVIQIFNLEGTRKAERTDERNDETLKQAQRLVERVFF